MTKWCRSMIPADSVRPRMNRKNSSRSTAAIATPLSIRSTCTTTRFRILFSTNPRARPRTSLLQHKPRRRRPKSRHHDENPRAFAARIAGRATSDPGGGVVARRATQSGYEGLRAVSVQGDQARALRSRDHRRLAERITQAGHDSHPPERRGPGKAQGHRGYERKPGVHRRQTHWRARLRLDV